MNSKFRTREHYFFLIVTVLNLFPVFSGMFFPTLDGAAHLYNSNLINTLLFDDNAALAQFFMLNTEPVPNWTGHFLLSAFNLFLPGFVAEKIVLVLYLILLPLSFRSLVKTISPDNYLLSYFIFPLAYSSLFKLGFYNFLFGLVFMFYTLSFLIKNEPKLFSRKVILVAFLLFCGTYFSHIFVFGLLLILIAFWLTIKLLVDSIRAEYPVKQLFLAYFKKAGVIAVAAGIPLILAAFYFYSRPLNSEQAIYIEPSELLAWLTDLRPIVVYNYSRERIYTTILAWLAFGLFLTVVYLRAKEFRNNRNQTLRSGTGQGLLRVIRYSDCWFFSALFMLVLFFSLPDGDNSAGFVSPRLGLLFFLIFFVWLATQKLPFRLSVFAVGIIVACNFMLDFYYSSVSRKLNKTAVACYEVADYIEPNSIVLPLNFSDHWLHGHFSNYLGIDKPMVILENYECEAGYFPIKWNEGSIPKTLIGEVNSRQLPCTYWKSNEQNPPVQIDYVFILGDIDAKPDNCTQQLKANILVNYSLTYQAENIKLYKLRENSAVAKTGP